jgi:hypothetical protein
MRIIEATINGVKYVECKDCGIYKKEIIVFKQKCVSCSGNFSLVRR